MAGDLVSFDSGNGRVEIRGLRSTIRDLERMGAEVAELRGLMESVGRIVADAARPLARHKSGAMAGSIRPGRVKTKAVVRAGGARIPYAGVQHYGWRRHNISADPFLTDALTARTGAVLDELDSGLAEIINRR